MLTKIEGFCLLTFLTMWTALGGGLYWIYMINPEILRKIFGGKE